MTGEQQPGGSASLSGGTPFLNGKGPQFSVDYAGLQSGMDLWRQFAADGSRDLLGVYIGYVNGFGDVRQVYSSAKAGDVSVSGYAIGAYATHSGAQGWYVDAEMQGVWFDRATGSTATTGMAVSGDAWTASLQAGDPFRFASHWAIEPQAQIIYQYGQMGSGADAFGATRFGDAGDVRGRIGAKLSYAAASAARLQTRFR